MVVAGSGTSVRHIFSQWLVVFLLNSLEDIGDKFQGDEERHMPQHVGALAVADPAKGLRQSWEIGRFTSRERRRSRLRWPPNSSFRWRLGAWPSWAQLGEAGQLETMTSHDTLKHPALEAVES